MNANELDYLLADMLGTELVKRNLAVRLFGHGSECYQCCVVDMLRPVLRLLEVWDKYLATPEDVDRWYREWEAIRCEPQDAEARAWDFLKYLRRDARAVRRSHLDAAEGNNMPSLAEV